MKSRTFRIRELVQNVLNEHLRNPTEVDEEDSMLSLLKVTEEAGQTKLAQQLLDLLPKEETDTVKDFQAIARVEKRELYIDDNLLTGEEAVRQGFYEAREEALEHVKDRLEVSEDDDGFVRIYDPISKMRSTVAVVEEREYGVENAKESMARNVIEWE